MQRAGNAGIGFLTFSQLGGMQGLRHGVSLRGQGPNEMDFSLGQGTEEWRGKAERLAEAVGLAGYSVVRAGQVHGARVVRVDEPVAVVANADGLCTNCAGMALMLLGADCPLILVYDPLRKALAVGHAGWRGTVQGMAGKLVAALGREFGCEAKDLLAGIGPGICGNCYEVGAEVVEQMRAGLGEGGEFIRPGRDERHWWVDLAEGNRLLLMAAGVRRESIEMCGCCTFEQVEWFPSYRREGERAGRLAMLAGLTESS